MNPFSDSGLIRLLVIDSDVDWADRVRRMFEGHHRIRVVGVAASGAEGVRAAERYAPDAVLINHALLDMTGLEAVDRINKVSPDTQIFLYAESSHLGLDLYRAGRALGVRQVFPKPFAAADVAGMIEEAVDAAREEFRRQAEKLPLVPPGSGPLALRGKGRERERVVARFIRNTVVAVTSPKGGVGKTMFVVNAACAVATQAAEPVRVAVVDFNEYEYLTTQMNLAPTADPLKYLAGEGQMPKCVLTWQYAEPPLDVEDLEEFMVRHKPSGVWVVPGVPSPEYLLRIDEALARKIIDTLREHFQLVLIDTPPSILLPATSMAVDLADHVVVVATPEAQIVRGANLLRDLLERMNVTAKCWRVDNRYNMPYGIDMRKIGEYIPYSSAGTIPDEPLVTKAINLGEPLALSDPQGEFARSIREVVNKFFPVFLQERVAPRAEAHPEKRGVFGRLFAKGAAR